MAWLHKLIWVYIPNAVLRIDQTLTSGRVTGSLAWLYRRLMYDRHPTIVVRWLQHFPPTIDVCLLSD
jgi:palmitoyltransferase